MFQILLCNVAVCGRTLSRWRVKTLPLALSHTSCTESHVGSVCCRHRVVHSSDHQCGQGAALGHERWHPTTVSSVHMHTDVSFNITLILSSITKVPIVFVGNWEAGLIRKKRTRDHCTHFHRWCATAHVILASLFSFVRRCFEAGFIVFNPCSCRRRLTVWALTFEVVAVFAWIKKGSSSCAWTIFSSCSWDVVLDLQDPFFLLRCLQTLPLIDIMLSYWQTCLQPKRELSQL